MNMRKSGEEEAIPTTGAKLMAARGGDEGRGRKSADVIVANGAYGNLQLNRRRERGDCRGQ